MRQGLITIDNDFGLVHGDLRCDGHAPGAYAFL